VLIENLDGGRSGVLRRIFVQRPAPPIWAVVISYLLISPVALLTPADVFVQFPGTRGFTDALAAWFPMINRVVAYGHPHPDKLRFVLAYAWCCVPVLVWLLWGTQNKFNKRKYLELGAFDFWAHWVLAVGLFLPILWAIGYWPNFPWSGREFFGPIVQPHDARRHLFWSTGSLVFYVPGGVFLYAGTFDFVRVQFLNSLWRIGAIDSYPGAQAGRN